MKRNYTKWTEEAIFNTAKKFNSVRLLNQKHFGLYKAAKKIGIWKEATAHINITLNKDFTTAQLCEWIRYKYSYNKDTGIMSNIASGKSLQSKHSGYIRTCIKGKNFLVHRLIFLHVKGRFPLDEIDHINHDGEDNRWVNLREVSQEDNKKNFPKMSNNTSGFTGVHLNKENNRWYAIIGIDNKTKFLGSFDIIDDAIQARLEAELKYNFHDLHGKEHKNVKL